MEYHPYYVEVLTSTCESRRRTVLDGQFDWGGCLNEWGSLMATLEELIRLYAENSVSYK